MAASRPWHPRDVHRRAPTQGDEDSQEQTQPTSHTLDLHYRAGR